jgi:nucleoside-diphosphate-sugar epimerase
MGVPLRIFIAGATGFIGQHLVKAFQARGHDVYGLAKDRMRAKILEGLACKPIIGNLLTNGPWERSIEYFDVAIGCTMPGKRGKPPTLAQVPELLKSHTDACSHLIEAVHDSKLRGVILTFGVSSYGDHGEEWIDEDMEFQPTGYGRIIGPAHHSVAYLAEARRVRATFLVPGWVYGNGGWFKEQLLPAVEQGQARVVGDGDNYMSLVHAQDLAEAYVLAAEDIGYAPPPEERPQTELINIVDDEPVRQTEWLSQVCQALGKPAPARISEQDATAKAGDLWTESITCSTRVKNDKAKQRLGWKPRYPSIKEGLPAAIAAAAEKQ